MTDRVAILAGTTVFVCAPDGPKLDGERAAADILGEMFGCEAQAAAIPVQRLADGFLDLATRIAGEVTQKFVNYGKRVAVVGDIGPALARSGALCDYVRECNRGGHVWFVADLAELEAKLAGPR